MGGPDEKENQEQEGEKREEMATMHSEDEKKEVGGEYDRNILCEILKE